MKKNITVPQSESNVSYGDVVWLNSRGGRNVDDVQMDKKGRKFVFMWGGNRERPVYLPVNYLPIIEHTNGLAEGSFGEFFNS